MWFPSSCVCLFHLHLPNHPNCRKPHLYHQMKITFSFQHPSKWWVWSVCVSGTVPIERANVYQMCSMCSIVVPLYFIFVTFPLFDILNRSYTIVIIVVSWENNNNNNMKYKRSIHLSSAHLIPGYHRLLCYSIGCHIVVYFNRFQAWSIELPIANDCHLSYGQLAICISKPPLYSI